MMECTVFARQYRSLWKGKERRAVSLQKATFGGGCFWCLEPIFDSLKGVTEVEPGYAGGHRENPTYEQVCTGTTGHAEVVQISFDPDVIAFGDLLEVFFAAHDPTTENRQGNDVGPQYRSIILYHDEKQHEEARKFIDGLETSPDWEGSAVVTELEPLEHFYPAERHHYGYFQRNPMQPYCRVVIAPKVARFRKDFQTRLKN